MMRECGGDSIRQIRMQTARRREEYIKANRLEQNCLEFALSASGSHGGFHFQHSSQYAKCRDIFILKYME